MVGNINIMAAENLRHSLSKELQVEKKASARDLVTEMDRAIERFFVQRIQEYYPTHRIIGEEGTSEVISDIAGMIWVIDPIDGTLNYVKQKNNFAIMIGLFQDGKPVAGYIYDVMKQDLYYGIVGDGAYLNGCQMDLPSITTLQESLAVGNVGMFVRNAYNSQRLLHHVLGVRSHGSAALEIIEYLSKDMWTQYQEMPPPGVAYFSAEFGLTETMQIYSGGLGILAGDHLKSASDLGLPLCGVGLFYRHGYFNQSLDSTHWQRESYPDVNPHDMPVELLEENGQPVHVTVDLGGRTTIIQIWVAHVGRVPLLLMDSPIHPN